MKIASAPGFALCIAVALVAAGGTPASAQDESSAEHTLEFAYQLVRGWKQKSKRIRKLMRRSRVVFVPVVNPDGFVAYPLNLKGVVVGQGDTADEALADVQSAIKFHIETFGSDVLEAESEAAVLLNGLGIPD